MIERTFWMILLIVLTLSSCNNTEKDNWANESPEIKYSSDREKEVWGRVLNGSNPGLFYGTELYELAKEIHKGKNSSQDRLHLLINKLSNENVNFQEGKYKETIGHFALMDSELNVVSELLDKGLDPNIKSIRDVSIMGIVNKIPNSLDLLKKMIKHGGDVNIESTFPIYRTPLIVACERELPNVKLLIKAGANPHYTFKHVATGTISDSPLHSALSHNNIKVVNYLIFDQRVDFKTLKRSKKSKYNPGGYMILYYLRDMTFKLGSEEYKEKMKLVLYLKEKGLDYYDETIPKRLYKIYDKEYLSKY